MAPSSRFFDGVPQLEATMAGLPGKLPLFYYDGSAQTAIFPARLRELRLMLPDPRFVPARLAPGLGVIAISCFEYRDTDIGPYNELAISIVLNEPWFAANVPGRALLAGVRRYQLHAWVHRLPVTTEIARDAGVTFYGYPKFVAEIEFGEEERQRTCQLAEGEDHILTLSGERIATPGSGQVQLFSHLWMDRQPQTSEFKINALSRGRSGRPGAAELTLGSHPFAQELARALVSRRSIHYELMPSFEGILYGPEHLSLPMIERLRERVAAGEPVAVD
jgi:hypothetical protein